MKQTFGIAIAQHSPKNNGVKEKRIGTFPTYQDMEKFFMSLDPRHAICGWFSNDYNCGNMIVTQAYLNEYKKDID
jgi:hypothetical protein